MKLKRYREESTLFESTGDLLDSTNFHSDCLHGLNARLDCDVKFDSVNTDHDYIKFIGKNSPELWLSTHDFKGLIELENYLKKKYWSGGGRHLSITVWPLTKATIQIEISVQIE